MAAISNDWLEPLQGEFKKPYYKKLYDTVLHEYQTRKIFPAPDDIFNAFSFTPLANVKVVILGQDPYHNDGQAHGLSFSVKPDIDVELLTPNEYSRAGIVMLLNTVLTVRAHQANSHHDIGWEQFTDAAIRVLNEQDRPMVFILWGRPAQAKKAMLNNPKHMILEAPHPSPLSAYRGFFGSRPFSKTNDFLREHGLEPIDWQIENIEK